MSKLGDWIKKKRQNPETQKEISDLKEAVTAHKIGVVNLKNHVKQLKEEVAQLKGDRSREESRADKAQADNIVAEERIRELESIIYRAHDSVAAFARNLEADLSLESDGDTLEGGL